MGGDCGQGARGGMGVSVHLSLVILNFPTTHKAEAEIPNYLGPTCQT